MTLNQRFPSVINHLLKGFDSELTPAFRRESSSDDDTARTWRWWASLLLSLPMWEEGRGGRRRSGREKCKKWPRPQ